MRVPPEIAATHNGNAAQPVSFADHGYPCTKPWASVGTNLDQEHQLHGWPERRSVDMKAGSWIIILVLLAILAAAGWYAYQGLTVDADVPMSKHGYIAMGLGFFFTLVVGVGLMALLFYSSRAGYDQPPHQIGGPISSNED
jgi:hypothetical protein